MLKPWHMPKSPDSSSTFFPRATAPIASPLHLHPAPYTCINACKFFYIFFVFFLLANIFSRYSGALCCVVPAFGPHCPWPSHISFFFVVSLCLHLVSKGCPSPATHHINPAPLTFSSSVDAVPLCCVNAPGIGHSYIISLHYK